MKRRLVICLALSVAAAGASAALTLAAGGGLAAAMAAYVATGSVALPGLALLSLFLEPFRAGTRPEGRARRAAFA